MRFVLTIELGNEAMSSQDEIALALRAVADRLLHKGAPDVGDRAPIRDANGNTVGMWIVESYK